MKIWRAATQFLVARDGGVFELIDASGAIVRRFMPSEWAIEDEIGVVELAVEGDKLVEHTRLQHALGGRIDRSDVQLEGLRADDDPETQRFVQAVLDDQLVAAEEARVRAERAADARVAAVAGATDDYGLVGSFEAAQRALIARIRRFDDTLAPALLRTLVRLARARVNPLVIERYAQGCLVACSERPPEVEIAVEPTPLPELAAELRARGDELEERGDDQERVDANLNAAVFWRAARIVRDAARMLGG